VLHAVLSYLALCSHLDPKRSQDCDPGLNTVNGDKLYFGGHGRVAISYTSTQGATPESYFSISKSADLPELLITGFYNGVSDAQNPALPLTRLVLSGLSPS
jgi:hypothetical protein